MLLRVFVDSDVVISSLLSSTGAAYFLIHQTQDLKLLVSNLSQVELETVASRLDISLSKLKELLEDKFEIVKLKHTANEAREEYKDYVLDKNDGHIILGANEAKAKFLITYNVKHYKIEKIKQNFNILIMTPGQLMQYLRSMY